MATYATFVIQFKEFAPLDQPYVQAFLDAAALEVPSAIWGAKQDQGIFYLAAHKLASSPMGNNARTTVVSADNPTTYLAEFRRLVRQVSSGFRVT